MASARQDRPQPDADRLLIARISGIARRHTRWGGLSEAEKEAGATELRQVADDKADLLAEVAGIELGAAEGNGDKYGARAQAVAELCRMAGADEALVPQGRDRARAGRDGRQAAIQPTGPYTAPAVSASTMRAPGRTPPGEGKVVSDPADIRGSGGSTSRWREIAAGHEAGHAVVAWHYGAHIDHVTVAPVTATDGTEARGCVKAGGLRSRRAEAACDLAGYAANITLQHVPADAAWQAARDDMRRLKDADILQDVWAAYIDAASNILTRRRKQWDRLCTRLLTADSLSWAEAATILGPRDPYAAR